MRKNVEKGKKTKKTPKKGSNNILTTAFSSSNSSAASALHSSVLPTPVGPRNRNDDPRCEAASPARLRITASATAETAASCPTTRSWSSSRSFSSLSFSVAFSLETGMPVQRETTAAMSVFVFCFSCFVSWGREGVRKREKEHDFCF